MLKNYKYIFVVSIFFLVMFVFCGFDIDAKNDFGFPKISEMSGGYTPTKDIIIGKYKVTNFNIEPSENSNQVKSVFFLIRNVSDIKDMKFYDCPNPKVTSKTISIKSVNTNIGVISIEGSFLPKTEQEFGFPPESPVLKAEVIIQKDGKIIYQKNHEFTYYVGY